MPQVPEFEADPRRKKPYIWVKWLTKLLAGEDRCFFKVWYKARHRYEKRADEACANCAEGKGGCLDPETCRVEFFRKYNELHDAIVRRRAEEFRARGYDVRVEDAANVKISGKVADVAGQPDLVALLGDDETGEAVVSDAKSGRARDSDHWQVKIYQFMLPLSWLGPKRKLRGEVEYREKTAKVSPLSTNDRERIIALIEVASGPRTPDATPSAQECRFCEVAKCPVRYQAPAGDATAFF